MKIRKFIATSLALFAALYVIGQCSTACSPLTPADKAQIAKDQIELGVCATEAHIEKDADAASHNAKAWAVFDDCMTRKGFKDGGSDAR